jgi:hypothetical protein
VRQRRTPPLVSFFGFGWFPKTSIAGQPLGWLHKSKIGRCLDSTPEKPPASTLHQRSQPSVAGTAHAASSPTGLHRPLAQHWHGTRRQLAYRPASVAGPPLARHTPPARLPTATPALHRRKKFSSPLLLLATHRKKFLRHLFSCSPSFNKALSRIPPSLSQQALFRAPQSLSGAHDSLWIHVVPQNRRTFHIFVHAVTGRISPTNSCFQYSQIQVDV